MTTDFCWLIERYEGSALVYWSGRKGEGFTGDPQWAVRFARFEDAEQVRLHVVADGYACRSVQHGFAGQPSLGGAVAGSGESLT